ncbi:DUF6286 domain-containing protein [Streptomyces sp. NPDC004609]|uniref:DUF6286 domain-containing protein n=1 Tax=Streptomyces sp. NPDC004609 TaxID=3364704 RepID=UPI0036C39047
MTESEPTAPVLDPDRSASGASHAPVPERDGESGHRAGRFWSVRRVPAALLALVVLGGAGILLYDIAAVRVDRPAMQWRRSLGHDLAQWQVDEPWVLVVAAAVALLGICLIVIAATPGMRSVLPMRRDEPSVRAGLTRDAAALVLRDRAMEVSGVQSARVRVGRSKVSVRARSHFRELDDVRADLDEALGAGIAELGLARSPALTVQVTRPPAKKR